MISLTVLWLLGVTLLRSTCRGHWLINDHQVVVDEPVSHAAGPHDCNVVVGGNIDLTVLWLLVANGLPQPKPFR